MKPLIAALAIWANLAGFSASLAAENETPPNFVVIFCDDLGYGDLACFGHPTIKTPHLDRMAREGMKFTQFYSAANVCTPSRAALLTGRYPIRNGMCSDRRRVLFPNSGGGIPAKEITLAEALKKRGYATGCVGKWHLGHLPQFLPTNNGFDSYFGIPYSNDMDRLRNKGPRGREAFWKPKSAYWNVPLLRDTKEIERPADQTTITKRYAEEAVKFIGNNKDKPFFLYLAHSMPHVPLFASKKFDKTSRRGLYGDVIEEIDWSVGQVMEALRKHKLDQNTLVWFTSDNGPWLVFKTHGGSAGLLREGKGTTWEGGQREPTLAWWPGKIKAGAVCSELGSTMDIFATCVTLAGGKIPNDRVIDGKDISAVFNGGKSPRETMFFYRGTQLYAVRHKSWKAHFITQTAYVRPAKRQSHSPPLLFNLDHDPSEKYEIGKNNADVIAKLSKIAEAHKATVKAVPSQLEIPLKK